MFSYMPEYNSWTQVPWSKSLFLFKYYLEKYTSEVGLEEEK